MFVICIVRKIPKPSKGECIFKLSVCVKLWIPVQTKEVEIPEFVLSVSLTCQLDLYQLLHSPVRRLFHWLFNSTLSFILKFNTKQWTSYAGIGLHDFGKLWTHTLRATREPRWTISLVYSKMLHKMYRLLLKNQNLLLNISNKFSLNFLLCKIAWWNHSLSRSGNI